MDPDDQVYPYSGDKTILFGLLTRPQGTDTWYWVKYKSWEISDEDYWMERPQNPTGWGIPRQEMEGRTQSGRFFFITKQPYNGKFIKKYGYNFTHNPRNRFECVLSDKQHGGLYVQSGTPFIKTKFHGKNPTYIFERPYEVKVITDTKIHKQLKIPQERVDFVIDLYKFFISYITRVANEGQPFKFTWPANILNLRVPEHFVTEYKRAFNTKYSFLNWGDRFMQVMKYLQQLGYIKITHTAFGAEIDLSPGLTNILDTPEGAGAVEHYF